MKNLAPKITRQRLIVEGFFEIGIDKKMIIKFFNEITRNLNLKMYGKPIVYATGKKGKVINRIIYMCYILFPLRSSGKLRPQTFFIAENLLLSYFFLRFPTLKDKCLSRLNYTKS